MQADIAQATVGFIGLGKMGSPIARRLIEGGSRVLLHDLSRDAVQALVEAGGHAAETPQAVASRAAMVFTCLPDLAAIEQVVLGSQGLVRGEAVEALIDLSTTGPQFARDLNAALAKHEIEMLDSPVTGGVRRARAGELAIIVSGTRTLFERATPFLERMGRSHYMGSGAGQAQMMKLVNNLLSQISTAATYEAFVLGVKAGLDPDAMLDVINDGTGRNVCTQFKMPLAVLPRTFDYGSNMEITYKDISLCMQEAERLGVTTLLGNTAKQMWGYGVHRGGAKRDSSTLITYLEEWAGVEVRGRAAQKK